MAITTNDSLTTYIENTKWLDDKALDIYRYINNDNTYRVMLRYRIRLYYKFEIVDKNLRIFYIDYDERDCMSYIDIPFSYIFSGNWESYIKELYKEWKQKDEEVRRQFEDRKNAQERELYEKLKLKYERREE